MGGHTVVLIDGQKLSSFHSALISSFATWGGKRRQCQARVKVVTCDGEGNCQ